MKLNEIICEDQQLDELLGGVGRAVGRSLGGLAKGYGYVAGIPKAMSAASQRGRAAAMANIGYGKFADQEEENPIYKQELEKRLGTSSGGDRVAAIKQEIQRLQDLLAAAQGQSDSSSAAPATDFAAKRAAGAQAAQAAMTPKATPAASSVPPTAPPTSTPAASSPKTTGYNYKTSIPAASTTGKYSGYSSAAPSSVTPKVNYNTSSGLLKPGSASKPTAPASTAAGSTTAAAPATDFAAKRAAGAAAAQAALTPKVTPAASPTASTGTSTDFAAKRAAGAQAAQAAMTPKTDDDLLNMFKARKSAPAPVTKPSTKFSQPKSEVQPELPGVTPTQTPPAPAPAAKQFSDKPENVRRREKRAEQSKVRQSVNKVAGSTK